MLNKQAMVAKKRAILISIVLLLGVLVGFLVTPRAPVTGAFIGAGWDLIESGGDDYNKYYIYTSGEEVLKIRLSLFGSPANAIKFYDAALNSENLEDGTIFPLVRYKREGTGVASGIAGTYNAFHGLRYDEKDNGYFLVLGTFNGNSYLDIAYANTDRAYYTGAYTDDILWLKKMAVDLIYK